jgi:O-antigen/teichoic acid export membrane protein
LRTAKNVYETRELIRQFSFLGRPEVKLVINSLSPHLNTDSKILQSRVLSGSFVLLVGTGSATVISLVYNVAMARMLGPTGFGHAAAVCTLLILVSAVTLSFQIVSAKIVAQQTTLQAKSSAYRGFHRRAWACGILVGLVLFVFQSSIARYLNLPTPLLVVLLGLGAAFYVPLGSRRGYLQGACRFHHLAVNVVLEGLVRLGGSLLCVRLGYGVAGVIAANAASVVMAYFFAVPELPAAAASELPIAVAFREGLQAFVFFAGAVIINNADIIVVKHFFTGPLAGLYAAISLVGRVVYVLSFSVVSSMFPIAAERRNHKRRDHRVLAISLLLVLAIGSVVTVGLRLAPTGIWEALFGAQFGGAGTYTFSYLLTLYAAMTSLYSLSVVIIVYEMSHKIVGTGWLQLAFSGVLVAAMYRYHSSLAQVIWVQMAMTALLLLVVAGPFLLRVLLGTEDTRAITASGEIRTLRQVTEEEVIAEFLKNDFYSPEFKNYRSLNGLVTNPDLQDAAQNELRRALFFLRHGALWRELPKGTQWFEIEVGKQDLERLYVFPRARWRKLAHGNFALSEVMQHLVTDPSEDAEEEAFRAKIRSLHDIISQDGEVGAILLIGLGEKGPLTILDGNHRVAAAMLLSSEAVRRFRFFCGLSPKMTNCCWYDTNFSTLCRYAKNLLKHVVYDPEAEVTRLLQMQSSISRQEYS